MANWVDLHFRARVHAANEPGFLAAPFLEFVALNGGHLGFCLNLGLDLATPAGREAANFYAALILFCHDLCALGVGHLPYHPAPHNGGGPVPVVAAAPEVPVGENHPVDNDFVEIIGGVHPIHGPWVVDHDFVEILGGVHPIHGPWVEGNPPAADVGNHPPVGDFNIDELVAELWEDVFGAVELNNEPDDQGNAPVN
jgi:hypothetical protein